MSASIPLSADRGSTGTQGTFLPALSTALTSLQDTGRKEHKSLRPRRGAHRVLGAVVLHAHGGVDGHDNQHDELCVRSCGFRVSGRDSRCRLLVWTDGHVHQVRDCVRACAHTLAGGLEARVRLRESAEQGGGMPLPARFHAAHRRGTRRAQRHMSRVSTAAPPVPPSLRHAKPPTLGPFLSERERQKDVDMERRRRRRVLVNACRDEVTAENYHLFSGGQSVPGWVLICSMVGTHLFCGG